MEEIAASPGFLALREQVLGHAELAHSDTVLDIGAGTGLLTLGAAPHVAWVHAVDVSPAMCTHLARRLEQTGVRNAEALLSSATSLPLADGSVDVVISNYCFHHLLEADKLKALDETMRVLRPGGRFVFADMMFRIGIARRRDRAVLIRFARRMLGHGPAGVMRLLKNVTRVLAGEGEHPASVEWWREALSGAGFVDVSVQALDHEGGLARTRKPA